MEPGSAASEALLSEIRSSASEFGPVSALESHGPHVYVEFSSGEASRAAVRGLTGTATSDGRPVVAVFFPSTQRWRRRQGLDQ